jgi:hypothetical protein
MVQIMDPIDPVGLCLDLMLTLGKVQNDGARRLAYLGWAVDWTSPPLDPEQSAQLISSLNSALGSKMFTLPSGLLAVNTKYTLTL